MCSGALADCEQEINGSLRIFRYGLAMCNIDDINELLIRIDFDRCFFRRFFRFCLYVGQCETFRLLIKLIHQWICPLYFSFLVLTFRFDCFHRRFRGFVEFLLTSSSEFIAFIEKCLAYRTYHTSDWMLAFFPRNKIIQSSFITMARMNVENKSFVGQFDCWAFRKWVDKFPYLMLLLLLSF